VAHKRASLGEAGKWVVADGADTHAFNPAQPTAAETEFMASLALEQLPPSARWRICGRCTRPWPTASPRWPWPR
jgi:hypothetical protein